MVSTIYTTSPVKGLNLAFIYANITVDKHFMKIMQDIQVKEENKTP